MRRGFTLIELLVVISIIALLIAILLPALSRAKYSARTTQCPAYKRQLGALIHAYAVDNSGLLPGSDPLPVITGRNPWDVSPQLTDDLIEYGMTSPRVWYCPADDAYLGFVKNRAPGWGADRPFDDVEDMKRIFTAGGTWSHHIMPLTYWVPREDAIGVHFPTIDGTLDHQDGWPRSLEDARGLDRPIVADRINASNAIGPNNPNNAGGGHRVDAGVLDSTTRLFLDGSAQVVPGREVEARSGPGITSTGNFYAFY